MDYMKRISKDTVLTILLFVTLATVIFTALNTQRVGEQNQRYLQNSSDYWHCLVVTDQEALKALGKEQYFAECDKLLFRDTGQSPGPRTRITIPSTTTTTGG